MTAVEYLFETLWDCPKDKLTWYSILEKAKKLEKQQIIDAWFDGYGGSAHSEDEYYNETYGSKGSDETLKENHIVDTNEMVSSQTEISDEEIKRKIEREIKKRYETTQNDAGFRDGWFLAIKWYREQLKKKQ
jgi:hypothetical protein